MNLSEHSEQAYVIAWARSMVWKWPELNYLHASQSGVRVSVGTARKAKAAGLVAGVPDLFLPVRTVYAAGLFIEMKRAYLKPKRGGKGGVSKEQEAWIDFLRSQGYMVKVAYGAESAISTLESYLRGDR